jgi:iron complex transport system ATP-binding protein
VDAWLGHRLVVQELDLTLKTGEHTVILGPDGAGKRVNLWELPSRIGLVFQDLQVGYPGGVVASDGVLSGFFCSGGLGRSQRPSPAQRQRVGELMERLGLADLACGGTTLLLVTHQIEAIFPEISRCVLLRQRKILGDGSFADLLQAGRCSHLSEQSKGE